MCCSGKRRVGPARAASAGPSIIAFGGPALASSLVPPYDLTLALRTRGPRRRNRRGQALVEFAVVSLVVYLLLAAILTFGQMLYSAQSVQQIANSAAREISRTPLKPDAELMDVLYSSDPSTYATSGGTAARKSLFNPDLLQYPISPGEDLLNTVRTWPVINQLLFPLMVPANLDPTTSQATYLVFPGAAQCRDTSGETSAASRTVWCVPKVTARAADGAETIEWVPVIEEITPHAFSLASTASQPGMVALRVNFGYQSPVMSAYPPSQTWPPEPTGGPYGANDGEVTTSPVGNYTPNGQPPMDSIGGTYSGTYGLGSQQAMTISVRPFRRLISAQAIYRREVFQ